MPNVAPDLPPREEGVARVCPTCGGTGYWWDYGDCREYDTRTTCPACGGSGKGGGDGV